MWIDGDCMSDPPASFGRDHVAMRQPRLQCPVQLHGHRLFAGHIVATALNNLVMHSGEAGRAQHATLLFRRKAAHRQPPNPRFN